METPNPRWYILFISPANPVQKYGEPGKNRNRNGVWIFLYLHRISLTKKRPKPKDVYGKSYRKGT